MREICSVTFLQRHRRWRNVAGTLLVYNMQDREEAELDCGNCQHTRHELPYFPPPWVNRAGAIRAYRTNIDPILHLTI
jgi:hypothetical protein